MMTIRHICAAALIAAVAVQTAAADPLAAPPATDESAAAAAVFDGPLDLTLPFPAAGPTATLTTATRPLPETGWGTKAGVDPTMPSPPITGLQPNELPQDPAAGAAWANVTAPTLEGPLSWDSATIETRLDPSQDQGRIGTRFSRSIPLGDVLSMTWQNGYSVTETRPAGTLPAGQSAQVFGTDQVMRLSVAPTDTVVSLQASKASGDERWLRSLGAEQKLFGSPFSVSGAVSETATGEISKSVKAGFSRSW